MNNLTLIVDGGWLMMSRFGVLEERFRLDAPYDIEKEKDNFVDMLFRSLFGILYKFPEIDNIIVTSEGGSWRKNIPVPQQLEETTYKGNREKESTHNWDAVYKAFDVFLDKCKELNITTSWDFGIEGDDWVWYWSRKLNSEGINTMIWTSDGDLKQLVQINDGVFTCWFNDKTGLVIPEGINNQPDILEYCLYPANYSLDLFEQVMSKCFKVEQINPDRVVMEKVISGDSGDNIKPCAQVLKGSRKYGIGPVAFKNIMNRLGNPKTISEFCDKFNMITEDITNNISTFKDYNKDDILEMLKYNLIMVWLNENTIPEDILNKMNSCEYIKTNCKELRDEGISKIKGVSVNVNIDELF